MSGGRMRGALVFALLLLGGCYSYAKLDTTTPPVRGWQVVATLSAPLDLQLQETTVHQVTVVAGQVVYVDPDSVVIAVSRFATASGNGYPGLGARATIRPAGVTDLQHKRISRFRTGLAFVAGAAAITGIVLSVGPLVGFGGSGGGDRQLP
jgi:hypothetical protein